VFSVLTQLVQESAGGSGEDVEPMKEAHIADREAAHADGLRWVYMPGAIRWIRGQTGHVPVRFFTDRCFPQAVKDLADVKVGLHMEPLNHDQDVHQDPRFTATIEWAQYFQYFISYDKVLLHAIKDLTHPLFCNEYQGCWVVPKEIPDKSKLVSIIASNKGMPNIGGSYGHALRHRVAARYPLIDRFGSGLSTPMPVKDPALLPYAFSVVIENMRCDDYWTEKVVDAFMCETIPIYWGSPAISDTFDMDGIITFNELDEIGPILDSLTFDLWRSKKNAIEHNRLVAEKYISPEHRLLAAFPFLFP
jgi:hypothetical protein